VIIIGDNPTRRQKNSSRLLIKTKAPVMRSILAFSLSDHIGFPENRLIGFSLAILPVSIMAGVLFLLRERLNASTVALLFLIPVMISTSLWGLFSGVFSAFTAFLAYNYLFLQPYYTFIVHETQDIVALLIFLTVAVINSQLVGRARSGMAAAMARELETTRLYELSLDLAGASSRPEIASALARKTADSLHASHLQVSISPTNGGPPIRVSIPENHTPAPAPDAVIQLETARGSLGEMHIWLEAPPLTPEEGRLLRAFAAQSVMALERFALADTETRARVLEESDRLKSALLSSVTHELRTPLATIKAATTSLISDEIAWDEPARNDLLSVVDEEADYLNYLVGNLLDMSRIEAGDLKPKRNWNVLSEIVDGVLARLHRILSGFTVEACISDDLPLIPVDYSQMEQVFINLLTNAAKYAPQASSITLEANLLDEDTAIVSITNEGPQVNPDNLNRIFDKFYRITEPDKVTGTGLGLSICKGIVEAHGGRIWAENLPGGLAFHFTLPLRLDGNPPRQVDAEEL
jgi:two-component system, OmpR family, sensor histidine kinase KdpD